MSDPPEQSVASLPAETPMTIDSTSRLIEPVALIYAALAAVGWLLELTAFPYVAAAYAGAVLLASIAASRGRVVVGPEGISAHYITRRVHIPWADVWALHVDYGILQRYVVVRRSDGRTFALPALRAPRFTRAALFATAVEKLERWSTSRKPPGPAMVRSRPPRRSLYLIGLGAMMAVALAVDRPWYWATVDAFEEAPNPCTLLAQGPAAAIGLTGPSVPSALSVGGFSGFSCRWTGQNAREIELATVLIKRDGLMSGAGVAADLMRGQWAWEERYARDRSQGVDVGEGGRLIVDGGTMYLMTRVSNVLILVADLAPGGRDNQVDAIAVARHTIDELAR